MFFCCFILIFRNRSRKKGGWNLDERVISTVEKEVEILPTFTSLVSYVFFYDLKKKKWSETTIATICHGGIDCCLDLHCHETI